MAASSDLFCDTLCRRGVRRRNEGTDAEGRVRSDMDVRAHTPGRTPLRQSEVCMNSAGYTVKNPISWRIFSAIAWTSSDDANISFAAWALDWVSSFITDMALATSAMDCFCSSLID